MNWRQVPCPLVSPTTVALLVTIQHQEPLPQTLVTVSNLQPTKRGVHFPMGLEISSPPTEISATAALMLCRSRLTAGLAADSCSTSLTRCSLKNRAASTLEIQASAG